MPFPGYENFRPESTHALIELMIRILFRFYFASLLALTGLWAQSDYTFSDGGRKSGYLLSQDEVFSATARMRRTRDRL